MQSWQAGINYNLIPQLTVSLAPVITSGYESSRRDIPVKGPGLLGGINYRVDKGLLNGLNAFIAADIGREKRDGSALGDRLDYRDVKTGIQYDFMLK